MDTHSPKTDFVKENWFKIGIVAALVIVAIGYYQSVVILPQQEKEREVALQEAAKTAEEQRELDLQTCLDESEYLRTSSHIALCGDPNVGYSSRSCFDVFSGTVSYSDAISNYEKEFPGELPALPESGDEDFVTKFVSSMKERDATFSAFYDTCNCGLEKYRRDELDEDKANRDDICFQKHGKK